MKNRYLIYFIIAGLFLGSFFGALIHNQVDALSFGNSSSSGLDSTTSIENVCVAGYYQMGTHDGIGNNIGAYIVTNALWVGGNAQCKLYYGSNGTGVQNGVTVQVAIPDLNDGFVDFTFLNPKPKLTANIYYYIVVFAYSGGGTCLFKYSTTGTSTTTSKTATYSNFPTSWTSYTNIDTSSTPRIYCNYDNTITNSPSPFNSVNKSGTDNTISLTWSKDAYATYTRIMYKTTYFPSSITDGTLAYNNTGTSYDLSGLNKNTIYFFSAWCYDTTIGQWSTTYSITCNRTVSVTSCGSTALTVYNNTNHVTGKYETSYNNTTGNKVWLNFTGAIPSLTQYSNIVNATGTHNNIFNTALWKYLDWANYTGNTSICGNCTGVYYINYTDSNITFNATINFSIPSHTLSYNVNDTNWIYTGSAIVLDNAQFFLGILLSIWLFFLSKMKEDSIFGVFQLFIGLPLAIFVGGISYINSLTYGYFIGSAILLVSLLSLAFVYWKPKNK